MSAKKLTRQRCVAGYRLVPRMDLNALKHQQESEISSFFCVEHRCTREIECPCRFFAPVIRGSFKTLKYRPAYLLKPFHFLLPQKNDLPWHCNVNSCGSSIPSMPSNFAP